MSVPKRLIDQIEEVSILVQLAHEEKERQWRTAPQTPNGYPQTFQSDQTGPEVFDPALKHFGAAYRAGDPEIADRAARERWGEARRQVITHLLTLISRSPWHEHLVLRGSLLLKVWMGATAREPGDIDWVFTPASEVLGDQLSEELFEDLRAMVAQNPHAGNALIDVKNITRDDIWTYERASGRRMVFPWQAGGLPAGSVQIDVVFSEPLPDAPIRVDVSSQGSPLYVRAASPAVSLAWKLLWLETDMYPQGKDLYDAVLLAERTFLPLDLLYKVLRTSAEWPSEKELTPDFPMEWNVDWENFQTEYPWVEGSSNEWQERLCRALAPTFGGGDGA